MRRASPAGLAAALLVVAPAVAAGGGGRVLPGATTASVPETAVAWPEAAPAEAERPAPPAWAADLLAAMDPAADPCSDFYRYACGGWLDATPLPGDQTRWLRSFSVVHERTRAEIRALLEGAAAEVIAATAPGAAPAADTDRARVGTFFAACMDEQTIELVAAWPLAQSLGRIATATRPTGDRKADLAALLEVTGELHRTGVGAFFDLDVQPDAKHPELTVAVLGQGGLGLPERGDYLDADPRRAEIRAAYERHVAHLLELLGANAMAAITDAGRVVAFETRLAEASRPPAEMRDAEALYHRLDLAGLVELAPELPWASYFAGLGHPEVVDLVVSTPEFFQALGRLIPSTDAATLAAYLRWRTAAAAARYLSRSFVEAEFDFYGRTLGGQRELPPRWKRCVAATERALGEAVGRLYVGEHFAGGSKEVALAMIAEVEAAFEADLPTLAWMDDATRERAVAKEHAIADKIGYPDAWRDDSKLALGREFYANVTAAAAFERDRRLAKVGGPVDRGEWEVPPQTVDAYNDASRNAITFPAGILQPPFFSPDFPAAMNYGAIGSVVGHELTHGFDDQGRKFDPTGALREWWAPEAAARFEERARCVADAYSAYAVEPGLHVDGALTLGENIADLGGVKAAYQAFQRTRPVAGDGTESSGQAPPSLPGLTDDQLFFLAFAQTWCEQTSPESARVRARVDPHAPPRFRVAGPLAHLPAFAAAFRCAPGTPMNPAKRCEVW